MKQRRTREFIPHIVEYCRSQFPKTCGHCGKEYADFETFLSETEPVGIMAWDESDAGSVSGTLSIAQCACGSTVTVECGDHDQKIYRDFLQALENDAREFDMGVAEFMGLVRDEIRHAASGK